MKEENKELPQPALQKKKRYEWIDNARIVAAFLIMMHHLPYKEVAGSLPIVSFVKSLCLLCVYNGRVPFFLILAGYFLSRNVTWKKAWNRFIWLLIPFVIWNAVYAYGIEHYDFTIKGACVSLLGLNHIIHSGVYSLFGSQYSSYPVIGPSWFLRDIMVLSLLTPLIVRFAKWIPCILVVMTAMMLFNMPPGSGALLSPTTVYFYLLGVALVRFRLDDAYRILNRGFCPYFALGILASCAAVTAMYAFNIHEFRGLTLEFFYSTSFGMVFGALVIAYCGILIEKLTPRVSKKLAPLGPACFLVFMLHFPIFQLLQRAWPSLFEGPTALLVPIPVFVSICAFFLGMKRFTPFLLPYLGHMKMPKKTPQPAQK